MKHFIFLVLITYSKLSHAHVKWFSNYDFLQPPLKLADLNTPYFWGLFTLSLITLPLFLWVDKICDKSVVYKKMNDFLDQFSDSGPLIMRVAMGAVLLMSWQSDSIVAPEIMSPSSIWSWLQFLMALLLLSPQTTPITGVGILFLYLLGITQEGFFHMLDYVVYPSVGLYLIFSHLKNEKYKNFDLPVLYSGLGFSLCWVAFEKMIYPYWGLSVLAKAPALTMGLPHDFFLISCAFIEFTLGYLLIICLLQRPLAAIITLVFFTTTVFFGKTEVVGHTILHGALLVFIVKGPGHYYQAPFRFHKTFSLRCVFAIVNFIILFALLAFPYEILSERAYQSSVQKKLSLTHGRFVIPEGMAVPKVMIHPERDLNGGWNLHFMTENFKFTPESAGMSEVAGEGHAHLYVDNIKVARVYGNWFHLNLGKGRHSVKITLNTNNHKDYYEGEKLIEAVVEIDETREVTIQHQH